MKISKQKRILGVGSKDQQIENLADKILVNNISKEVNEGIISNYFLSMISNCKAKIN